MDKCLCALCLNLFPLRFFPSLFYAQLSFFNSMNANVCIDESHKKKRDKVSCYSRCDDNKICATDNKKNEWNESRKKAACGEEKKKVQLQLFCIFILSSISLISFNKKLSRALKKWKLNNNRKK